MDLYGPPSQLQTGQLQTRNSRGFDMGTPCYKIEAWVDAYDGKLPLFDIGSGYGTNIRAALARRPEAKVVAVDFCDDHLAYIRAASPDAAADGRLRTVPGRLPDDVPIEENGASGILIAQVIHFLSPSDVRRTFENAARWLAPGGTLVLLCMSHYFQPFIDTGRVAEIVRQIEADGDGNPDSWPGWIEDVSQYAAIWQLPAAGPSLHTFTDAQIRVLAERAGLEVVECGMVSGTLSNYPAFLCVVDPQSPYYGKEQVVLVARKPGGSK